MRSFLLLLAVLLSGCATTQSSYRDGWFTRGVELEGPTGTGSVTVRYRAGEPSGDWERGPAPPGDFSLYSGRLGTTLYADTSCGKRYHDAPLTVLANHLTMGFEGVEVREAHEVELGNRAGLERLADASIDGVPVTLALAVVKKGPCVFDLVMVGSPSQRQESVDAFREFTGGFVAEIAP